MPRIYGISASGAVFNAHQPVARRRCCECREMVPVDDFPLYEDEEGRKRMRPYCRDCEPAVMERAARERERDAKLREKAKLNAKYRRKPVYVDGVRYGSLTAAAAAAGTNRITLREALNRGAAEFNGHAVSYVKGAR